MVRIFYCQFGAFYCHNQLVCNRDRLPAGDGFNYRKMVAKKIRGEI